MSSYRYTLSTIANKSNYQEGQKISEEDLNTIKEKVNSLITTIANEIKKNETEMHHFDKMYFNGFDTLMAATDYLYAMAMEKLGCPDIPASFGADVCNNFDDADLDFEDEIDDYVETTRVYDSEDKSEYHDETTIKASIPSFKALMNLYINNMEIRDELIKGMQQADNKKVYDTYKKLYDALMTVKLNMDFYKNPETGDFYRDEQGDATYSAYLAAKDPSLYAVVLETENFVDETSRNQYIATVIDSIIYALEEYLDTKEFSALFSNLPIMSIDAVKGYIATVINFYKSYKVHFLGINTIYTFADKSDEGSIRIIDDLFMNRFFQRSEFIKLYEEFSKSFATMSYTERVNLIERIYFDISTWVYRYYDDEVNVRDRIGSMLVSFITNTYVGNLYHFY